MARRTTYIVRRKVAERLNKAIFYLSRQSINPPFAQFSTLASTAPQSCELQLSLGCNETRWVLVSANLGQRPSGDPTLRVVLCEIGERKKTEKELRDSMAFIEAIIENVPLMIFLKEAASLRFAKEGASVAIIEMLRKIDAAAALA